MGRILGAGRAAEQIGAAVGGVAEVFVGNEAERDAARHAERQASLAQFGGEFAEAGATGFDRFVNGLNRLPRPCLALGSVALFVYAMAAPAGFGRRMEGLALVPEPLWWLMGAVVSFYFGARELHYQRVRTVLRDTVSPSRQPPADAAPAAAPDRRNVARRPRPAPAAAVPAPDDPSVAADRGAAVPPAAVAVPAPIAVRADDPEFNAAVEEWRRLGG